MNTSIKTGYTSDKKQTMKYMKGILDRYSFLTQFKGNRETEESRVQSRVHQTRRKTRKPKEE